MSRRLGVSHKVRSRRPPVNLTPPASGTAALWDDTASVAAAALASLELLGSSPKRALSQSFLVSASDIDALIASATLTRATTVVEIGPGTGALTRRLVAECRKVIAIELDDALAAGLTDSLGSPANLVVCHGDALLFDLASVVEEPFTVVASLPYHAATPIVHRLLYGTPKPKRLVIMVQAEVAERLAPVRGPLSYVGVTTALMATGRIVKRVPPTAFYPQPKVWSAITRLDVHDCPIPAEHIEAFLALVRAGFAQPRKVLHNSLAQGLGIGVPAAAELVAAAGIAPGRRPGELNLTEWQNLLITHLARTRIV